MGLAAFALGRVVSRPALVIEPVAGEQLTLDSEPIDSEPIDSEPIVPVAPIPTPNVPEPTVTRRPITGAASVDSTDSKRREEVHTA
jgi:hypothetical protein